MHARFSGLRRKGEWFDFSSEMLTIEVPDDLPEPEKRQFKSETRQALFEAIRDDFAYMRNAAENLAAAANSRVRSAHNWLSGRNSLDASALIHLLAASPAVARAVDDLIAEKRLKSGMAQRETLFADFHNSPSSAPAIRAARAEWRR